MANLAFTMQDLRTRLAGVRNTDDGFQACCPAHEDRTPSLSVSLKSDRILVHCHAGCGAQAVLDRVGLSFDDLFADGCERRRNSASRFTCAPPPRPDEPPPPDYEPLLAHARSRPDHRHRLLALADHLGALPESREAYADAADRLGVVWLSTRAADGTTDDVAKQLLPFGGKGWRSCWGIPERDHAGVVVGIGRRYEDGCKKHMTGGRRGLVYDPTAPPPSTVACVEGASDVIALAACGVCAVGRPSNVGGSTHLIDLVSLTNVQELVVMGENDRKGDRHPGLEGVRKVGLLASTALPNTTVKMALPQETAKDARAWIAGRSGADVGAAFVASLVILSVSTPHPVDTCASLNAAHNTNDKERLGKNIYEGTLIATSPIAGLLEPPSPCSCSKRVHLILSHTEDPTRGRVGAFACDSWQCTVCRLRLAHAWATHLADCCEAANRRTLRVGHVTERELAKLTRPLTDDHGADYAALETAPGCYLLIVAATPTANRWQRLLDCTAEVTLGEAQTHLAQWCEAAGQRTDYERRGNGGCRPVLTSRPWARRPAAKGEWRRVARLDEVHADDAARVIREEGAAVVRDVSRLYGVSVPEGCLSPAAVWVIEWRADPEVSRKIAGRLAMLGDCDGGGYQTPPRVAANPEDLNPFLGEVA